MINQTRRLRSSADVVDLDLPLLGKSLSVAALRHAVEKLGQLEVGLLLHGEPGSGKHACAFALHQVSPRRASPFFSVHLDGMSEIRMYDTLFGPRGVTSATVRARRATIYLDGIEFLPQRLQPRLLASLAADSDGPCIRLIAGTAVTLDEHVRIGRFHRRLFDRLATIRVSLPPLRERREDVPTIARAALARWAERNKSTGKSLGDSALAPLMAYDWPANVRELLSVLASASEHTRGLVISADRIRNELGARPRRHVALGIVPLKQVERDYLLNVMERCAGNQTLAARRLGIGRSTLVRRLHACGYPLAPTSTSTSTSPTSSAPLAALPASSDTM